MPRTEITTDAEWRNRNRMTQTQRDNAKRTGFSLAMQASVNAEMLAEGLSIWGEIQRQADETVRQTEFHTEGDER